jgi:hypothetical protein
MFMFVYKLQLIARKNTIINERLITCLFFRKKFDLQRNASVYMKWTSNYLISIFLYWHTF